MSGSGGGGGYEYQADAFAYVIAHAVTEQPLGWFEDTDDVPIAVSVEAGGAGDDLRVELRGGGVLEVQCKHGAKKDQHFAKAFLNAARGLAADSSLRVVLLVDGTTVGTITNHLRQDIIRLGQGRTDKLKPIGDEYVGLLRKHGIASDANIFSRLRVIIKDLKDGMDGQAAATTLLARVVRLPSQTPTAWKVLGREGLDLTQKRGRRDVGAILRLLGKHVTLSAESLNNAASADRYRQWSVDANASFAVAGLNVRLPISDAWDKLFIGEGVASFGIGETLANQISRYHEWERLAERARRESGTCRAEDAIIGKERLIITGGPGAGKSTLSRRLVERANRRGGLALRVSLPLVARMLRDGASFDASLMRAALDTSGIPHDVGRGMLASPDYVIADGLDECDPDRAVVANHLTTWAAGHPDCHVCVMTRPVGHTASLLPGFDHAELLPLDDEAIKEYSAKLLAAKIENPNERKLLHTDFVRLVVGSRAESRAASIAARNPLLLSFMLSLFLDGKPLTGRRAELFEQIIDLVRRTPMSDRSLTAEVDEAVAERVIEVAAWRLIGAPDTELKTLREELAQDLVTQAGSAPLEARRLADRGLRFWEDRRLIERVAVGNSETYTFVHLSLGEYLAGRYISRMTDADLRLWLASACRDARWRQPILLAGGTRGDRVPAFLLEIDDPDDPISAEAMLAASVVSELARADARLAEQITSRLRERLTSAIPLVAIEAGEGLRQLAAHAPAVVAAATENLLAHEQQWTRLAAYAARLAAGREYVTLEEVRTWLNAAKFVRRLHYTSEPAESRIADLPDAAYDLQEYAFIVGIERLFEELEIEEARSLSTEHLKRVREGITSGMLTPLGAVLDRYRAEDIIDAAFEMDDHRIDLLGLYPPEGKNSPDIALTEAILSAMGAEKLPPGGLTAASAETEFISLSTLITSLGFLRTSFTEFDVLSKRRQEAGLHEVLRGMIAALELNPIEVAGEATTALSRLKEAEGSSLTDFIRNVPAEPDWSRVESADLDAVQIVDALAHPSAVIVRAAVNLLLAGVSEEDARPLIRQLLPTAKGYALGAIAYIAPRLWSEQEAAGMLLERLDGAPSTGFEHIYKSLARLVRSSDDSTRGAIAKALLDGLYADENAAAVAAAESLANLPLASSQQLRDMLKRALDYWTERVEREEKEAPVRRGGSGDQSYTIRVVEPDPLGTLMMLLARLGAFGTEELLRLCEDQGHGVSGVAYKTLTAHAGVDPELLGSLLTRIKEGLPPHRSATALNLLDALLNLPSETLTRVSSALSAVLDANIPAVRARVVASLTAGWIDHQTALKLARKALSDPTPGVRNTALKTLRLLSGDVSS